MAVFNKTKRKMFENNSKFSNGVDYLVFIMEVVEEHSYLLSSCEKHTYTLNIARKLNIVPLYDELTNNAILDSICKASKKRIKVNLPKKSILAVCFKS